MGPEEWAQRRRQYEKAWYSKIGSNLRNYRLAARAKRKVKNPAGVVYTEARSRARKTGILFTISVEDIIIPDACPIFGWPLFHTPGKRTKNTPSLDRIDPSRGYVKGNVIVVSWKANEVKMGSTPDELIKVGNFYKALEDKMKDGSFHFMMEPA